MPDMNASADTPELGAFAELLPAGLLDMFADVRARAAELDTGDERLDQLAAELRACREQLAINAATCEMLAEMIGRLFPAWNALAANVDALTAAMSGPIARIGLTLTRVPRV